MFWKKNAVGEKLSGPREIPEPVGRYLVVQMHKNPDWVWNLKAVVRPQSEEDKIFDVRVFDGAQVAEKKVSIKNYTSFDEHPELVLYEGWFNKKTMQVEIKELN